MEKLFWFVTVFSIMAVLSFYLIGCASLETIDEIGMESQSLNWKDIKFFNDDEHDIECEKFDQRQMYRISPTTAGQLIECNKKESVNTFATESECQNALAYYMSTELIGYYGTPAAPAEDPGGEWAAIFRYEHPELGTGYYGCTCNGTFCP
jgi:hypothetical protein